MWCAVRGNARVTQQEDCYESVLLSLREYIYWFLYSFTHLRNV